jgi:hypothetical protein
MRDFHTNEFLDYVLGFYGPGELYDIGMTREEAALGYLLRLTSKPHWPFEGDTVDRELVRDEVLAFRSAS